MGQKVVLSEAFTDTSLPILYDDAMQAAGTLAILDFGHSLGGFAGVPVDGSQLPNVAWKSANQLVAGAPGQAALALNFQTNQAAGVASVPIKERTPKKGLNIIYSQANDIANNWNRVQIPQAIFDYMVANIGHAFYWSVWHRVTRSGVQGAPYGGFMNFGVDTANTLMVAEYKSGGAISGGITPNQGNVKRLGADATPANSYNTVANQLIQAAVQGVTGSIGSWDRSRALPYFWGHGAAFSNLHIAHSGILYRLTLEDLTVSGRTYAQAAAIDQALWAAAFAAGGKFYGDTYTDVTSYP